MKTRDLNKGLFLRLCLILLVTIAGLSSCKPRKVLTGTEKQRSEGSKIIEQVLKQELSFQSIEIKGSARLEMEENSQQFSITYRNYSDSLIWVSVRALLGIEVARLKCTPEKLWIFSRLADINESGDWSAMAEYIGYPVDFFTLQGMMTRTLFIPGDRDMERLTNYLTRNSEKGVLLLPDYNSELFRLKTDQPAYFPVFLVGKDNRLIRSRIAPESNLWQFEMDYGAEAGNGKSGLPDEMRIHAMDSNEQYEVVFRIQSVSINQELKTPYSWD